MNADNILYTPPPKRRRRQRKVVVPEESPVAQSNAGTVLQEPEGLTCPICLTKRWDVVFLRCGHHLCATDCTKLLFNSRKLFCISDKTMMNCYQGVTRCPECKAEIEQPTLVRSRQTLCSSSVVVPKEEFYNAMYGSVCEHVSCDLCGESFSSARALVLHHLDSCTMIKGPCDICKQDVGRDVGDHVDVCTRLWCRHNGRCGFRGTRLQIQQHMRIQGFAEMADDYIRRVLATEATEIVRRVDEITQTMALLRNDNASGNVTDDDDDDNNNVAVVDEDDENEEIDLLSPLSPSPRGVRRSSSPVF